MAASEQGDTFKLHGWMDADISHNLTDARPQRNLTAEMEAKIAAARARDD